MVVLEYFILPTLLIEWKWVELMVVLFGLHLEDESIIINLYIFLLLQVLIG